MAEVMNLSRFTLYPSDTELGSILLLRRWHEMEGDEYQTLREVPGSWFGRPVVILDFYEDDFIVLPVRFQFCFAA